MPAGEERRATRTKQDGQVLVGPGAKGTVSARHETSRMFERARRVIPGVSQLLSKRPDQFSLGVWPTFFKQARGCRVWDLDGNEYLDMSIAGIGANVLGYCDPHVDAAVDRVLKAGNSSSLLGVEDVLLAERLIELHPWAERARFARTGGEAMAVAVRTARARTERDVVAFCGYHGWHDWYLAANLGSTRALDEHLLPGLSPRGVPRALRGTSVPYPFNDPEGVRRCLEEIGDDLGAVVLEPIRGQPPSKAFIDAVQRAAREKGAPLIVDEVSSGFRLNNGGAHLSLGIQPDIAVFSKALGNGYPIAAIIGRADAMDAIEHTFVSSTYWTERIGPAAALATLERFVGDNVARHLIASGERVQAGWRSAAAAVNVELKVGGIRPLAHFEFGQEHSVRKALFVQGMLHRGFLASNQYYAMDAHDDENLDRYLHAVEEVFAWISALIAKGETARALRGKPAASGFTRMVA